MELTSAPEYTEETVTDLAVGYLGSTRSLVLRPEDTIKYDAVDAGMAAIQIFINTPPELIILYKAQMQWFSATTRTLKFPKGATTADLIRQRAEELDPTLKVTP